MPRFVAVLTLVAVAAPAVARAQDDYFVEQQRQPLSYRVEGSRTPRQRIVLGSLLGTAALAGGLGLYVHLKSRDAADDVTAHSGEHTGRIYTRALDDRRRDADRYSTAATALYVTGGAALVGAVVYLIWTSPDDEVVRYGGPDDTAVSVVPVRGGAVVGATWAY